MKRWKLKISKFVNFLIIICAISFPLETNAKSAKSHTDSLEVVKDSLTECSDAIGELLEVLKEDEKLYTAIPIAKKTLSVQEIAKKVVRNDNPLSSQKFQEASDWQNRVDSTLINIDDTVKNIDEDLENEANAYILSNQTAELTVLTDEGRNLSPIEIQKTNFTHLVLHATSTKTNVDEEEDTVSDEYDKYDKQRKVTISLSTLGAAIVVSLVIVMLVIYHKNKKKRKFSDSSSTSSERSTSSLEDKKEKTEPPIDIYTTSLDKIEIPRAKSIYTSSDQPSTSQAGSSSRLGSERDSQMKY